MQRRLIMRLLVTGALALAGTVLLSFAGGERQASAACPFERTVTTQGELDETIVCYNAAVAGEKYVIVLGNEISLTGPLIFIDNSTTAELTISGEGNMIDGKGLADYVFRQNNGNVTVTSIAMTGGAVAGFAAVGGPTTIEGSTLSGNENGLIAISLDGVTVRNSTLSANVVQGISNTGPLKVIVSTISDNGSDGIGFGVGVTISGSIVAKNMAEDCGTPVANDLGGNVFGTTDCNGVATPSVIDSLGTLGANGCSSPCTHTIALLANSPAIDAAGTCGVKDDQRGIERATDQCDAGAYEAGDCSNTVTVSTEAGLEFGVHCYNLAPAGATNTIFLGADITLTSDLLSIDNSTSAIFRLRGEGYTIDANGAAQNVLNQVTGTSSIRNVTLTGGGIVGFRTEAGSTQIDDATISGNENGMVVLSSANVLLRNSSIAANEQRGIGNTGSMTIFSSTIVDNGSEGLLNGSDVVMADSIVAGNLVEDCGSPVSSDGGGNVFGSTSCNGVATPGLISSLGSLGANGCIAPCTETVALLPGSPAIDAAGSCIVTTDQRGTARTTGKCDAGAYEAGDCPISATVTTEAELEFAVHCYNVAPAATVRTFTLGADITLTSDLSSIDNSTNAILALIGDGYTIDADGAAINVLTQVDGAVEITNMTLTGAITAGVRAYAGTTLIYNSTSSGNAAGLVSESLDGMTVLNSTIAANEFVGIANGGPVTVLSSTIVDNGFEGLVSGTDVVMIDSILATHLSDCGSPVSSDGGGNVFGSTSCNGVATPGLISSLGSLGANGCTAPCTETVALLPGSPAIDAAGLCTVVDDQRGEPRTAGQCDAGSYEAADCSSATSVSTESDLAFAIGCYNNGPADSAWFVTLAGDIMVTNNLLAIDNDAGATVEIDGAGHMIDAAGQAKAVLYMTDGDLSLFDVTLTGAVSFGFRHSGGAALIDRSTITGNMNGVHGESAGGTTVRNSTIHGNSTNGIFADNPLSVISSTIVDNGGDGIDHTGVVVTLTGSLVARNGGADCNAGLHGDSVGNVFEDDSCAGLGSGTASVVGLLGLTLAPNGCTAPCTATIALLAGSPAIDVAADCGQATDQRGVARTVGRCDAGAFEFGDLMCNGKLVTIRAQAGVTTTGTTGDDVILGTPGDDVINALEGDDTVCALAGDDTVDTGPGNDTVFGDAGLDVILGLDGNDTLHGGDGRDIMRGGPGVDVLNGGNGNDRILGGIGNDVLNGEAGNDYLGGFGGNDTINGGPGDETIFGGFGADIINGGGGNDAIFGLIGNDVINGGAGNDKLNGDRGNDTINGGPGDDVISGGNANDILSGNDGDDIVSGGKADDTLAGNDGIDTCIGNLQTVADTADATCEFIFGVP